MKQSEVRSIREAANLSQYEVAALAGVSRSLYNFYERGMQIGSASETKIMNALREAVESQAKTVAKARRLMKRATAVENSTAA
jgi:transcriptional regulator with XRE-family HTH domain